MELFINFLDIKACVRTNSRFYADYLKTYFQPLVYDGAESDCGISIDIIWAKNTWKESVRAVLADDMVQVGGNTYLSADKAAGIVKEKRKVLFSWSQKEGHPSYQMIMRDEPPGSLWARWCQAKSQDQHLYETTLKGFYYPLFCFLRRMRQMTVLHASAVAHRGEGIVFCGLDGSGKTCMSLFLSQRLNMAYVSDNLVLADQGGVYPCYELIRLHQESARLLNDNSFIRWNKTPCMKDFYTPVRQPEMKSIKPKMMIFAGFHSADRVEKLSLGDAVNRAIHLTRLSGELSGYPAFFSLYSLLKGAPIIEEKEILSRLLEYTHCFSIQMKRSNGLEKNMNFLTEELGLK